MSAMTLDHEVTIWLVNDVPARMFYAGHRWKITDAPTRLRESVWSVPLDHQGDLYGWRFQATSETGDVFVFDVYRGAEHWRVHRTYA